jgi:sRNA-binding protein
MNASDIIANLGALSWELTQQLAEYKRLNVEAAKEAKEARRREKDGKAAEEGKSAEGETKSDDDKPAISDEEIDKKIDAALQDNA